MQALANYGSDSDSNNDDDDDITSDNATDQNGETSKSIRRESTAKSEKIDFFGLQDSSDNGGDSDDDVKNSTLKARKVEQDAEVPNSRYWRDFQPVVTEAPIEDLPRRKAPKTTKPKPVPFVSSGLTNDPAAVEQRKIYFVHHLISRNLNRTSHSRPSKQELVLNAHSGVVNSARWCRKRDYSHLAASAGSDGLVKLWNMFTESDASLGVVHRHEKAVSSLSWSHCGRNILTASYDRTSSLLDVEKRQPISDYNHTNYVTKVKHNPSDSRLFSTIDRDVIYTWDTRQTRKPSNMIRHPRKEVTSFLDFVYINDSKEVMASTDSCEHNLSVFDVRTGGFVSSEKELYPERYTCPRLVTSRWNRCVLAQSQGDYICEFNSSRPYKLNKSKRFQGHKVSGYPVGLDMTCDGKRLVSGSADSLVHVYDWYSSKTLTTIRSDIGVCTDVACHPVMANVVLVASWDGRLALLK